MLEYDSGIRIATMLSMWLFAGGMLFWVRHKPQIWGQFTLYATAGFTAQLLLFLSIRSVSETRYLLYPVHFALSVGAFLLCSQLSKRDVVYCGFWVMIHQQLCMQICSVIQFWLPRWGLSIRWTQIACVAWILVHVALAFGLLSHWMPVDGRYEVGPRQFAAACVSFAVFEILVILSNYGSSHDQPWESWRLTLLMELYCATLLYMQHESFKKSALRREVDVLNQLQIQQKQQYDLSKETIALINRKCHDLKHQVQAMRVLFADEHRESYLKELENAVGIYEALTKTGNEVLDTVLTEKSLYCEANSIKAHCVADGKLLDFMDPVDLYTIFGNALDNAIDCVRQIEATEKRIIDVLVYQENQFLVVQIINPVERELKFDGEGLPVTTKGDNGYHGFGLRSIRYLVQRYGGFLTVEVEKGCFYLRILIPAEQAKKTVVKES